MPGTVFNRSPYPGTTNLTKAYVITNINNVSGTNINYIVRASGPGIYDNILHNKYFYTNESWYGYITNATIIVASTTAFSITKSVSNILLNGVPSKPIPGAMIIYKIVYSNIGGANGNNVILYDKLPRNVSFFTEGIPTAVGWSFQYATKLLPDQSYPSGDYSGGGSYPAVKTNVKWVRWIKNPVGSGEKGLYLVYKAIIK